MIEAAAILLGILVTLGGVFWTGKKLLQHVYKAGLEEGKKKGL